MSLIRVIVGTIFLASIMVNGGCQQETPHQVVDDGARIVIN